MARTPQDVTDAELAVLQILWDDGSATRRRIADVLYPNGGPAHYTTVQKLLERLEAKGFVVRSRMPGTVTFVAVIDRESLISRRLTAMADKLCGGSLTPLLLNLVRSKPLSAREMAELRAALDQLVAKGKQKSR